MSIQGEVEVLWTEAGEEAIGRETLAVWDKELRELVKEMPPLTSASSGFGELGRAVVCNSEQGSQAGGRHAGFLRQRNRQGQSMPQQRNHKRGE